MHLSTNMRQIEDRSTTVATRVASRKASCERSSLLDLVNCQLTTVKTALGMATITGWELTR